MAGCGCGFSAHTVYTDEEAQAHAEEVGVNPRPMETKNEIDARGAFVRDGRTHLSFLLEKKRMSGRLRIKDM